MDKALATEALRVQFEFSEMTKMPSAHGSAFVIPASEGRDRESWEQVAELDQPMLVTSGFNSNTLLCRIR